MSLGKYLTRIMMPLSAGSGSVQRIAMWADGIYYIVVGDKRGDGQSGSAKFVEGVVHHQHVHFC